MLNEVDRAVLDLARRPWIHEGAKVSAIARELAMSPERYYQRLNALLESGDALAYAPALVTRLRRHRARARHRRIERSGTPTGTPTA